MIFCIPLLSLAKDCVVGEEELVKASFFIRFLISELKDLRGNAGLFSTMVNIEFNVSFI